MGCMAKDASQLEAMVPERCSRIPSTESLVYQGRWAHAAEDVPTPRVDDVPHAAPGATLGGDFRVNRLFAID